MSSNQDETAALREALHGVCCVKRKYSYALVKGRSIWLPDKGYPKKVDRVNIGSISLDDPRGECVFNEAFFSGHPEFKNWHVYRAGPGDYRFAKRTEEELRQPLPVLKRGRRKAAARAAVSLAEPEQGRWGAVYFLRSFYANTTSGKILKELLEPYWYERLLLLLCTGMFHGFEYQELTAKCREFCGSHIGFALDKFDGSTLDGLINELSARKVFDHLFSRKVELLRLQENNVNPVVYDCNCSMALGGAYLNLLTLIDEDSGELYDVKVYPEFDELQGEADELAQMQQACRDLKVKARALRMVSSRFSFAADELTRLLTCCCDFLVGVEPLNKFFKGLVLKEGKALLKGSGISIIDDKNRACNFASTRVAASSLFDPKLSGDKDRPVYLHFIFQQQKDREFMYFWDRALGELNAKFPQGGAEDCPALGISTAALLERGLAQYSPEDKRYVYVEKALTRARISSSVLVLASSFCTDPGEALRLFGQVYQVREGYGALPDNAAQYKVTAAVEQRETCRLLLCALLSEFEQQLRLKLKEFYACRHSAGMLEKIQPEITLPELLSELDHIEAKRQADGSFVALDRKMLSDLSADAAGFINWLGLKPIEAE
ncbi:MAG: hypothetical protein IAB19_04660 [Proteobacteria bacterium]|uniref:Uncharacterized protein n=1 Tax=Candidatus Avisuccinivibrio stercorigallinarum TaxID=2840704 RepID=A0A9D9DA59_9GAMM|nr:hypothetical protein [Candidatus Avisuccinivibrio stercorigallinarum]